MAKRKWKDSDLSAYIDGEMDPKATQALKSSLAEDPDLQQRLEEIREVSNLVRSLPLREPPRNYLLTPSMVTESEPEPEQRAGGWLRLPMWAMRLATSLTAAAFVITLSLSLIQQGLSPRMMMEEPDRQPQPEMLRLESEASPTAEIQAMQAEEAAPVEEEEAPAEQPPTPTVQGTLTPKEEMALEAMPAEPGGAQEGMGGGAEPPAPPEDVETERLTEETEAAEAAPDDASEAVEDEEAAVAADAAPPSPTPEAPQPEIAAAEEEPDTGRIEGDPEELGPPPSPPIEEEPPRILGPERWRWLAAVTGALTAILGGLTFWMSRNRR
jgi:hypothetical protein